MSHSAWRLAKRIATGFPIPSPKVKVVPREVVTRKLPRRIKWLSKTRSNRSIGRLPTPYSAVEIATARAGHSPDQFTLRARDRCLRQFKQDEAVLSMPQTFVKMWGVAPIGRNLEYDTFGQQSRWAAFGNGTGWDEGTRRWAGR